MAENRSNSGRAASGRAASGRAASGRAAPLLIVLLVLAAVVGGLVWYKLFREVPQFLDENGNARTPSVEELYKYGSIGAEESTGIPFWIWLSLPTIFPEYLPAPGGYASLGFAWEEGQELPVGFSKKTIGYDRVGINCALCHSATLRGADDAVPAIYPGGPSHTADVLSYQRFLFQCGNDPRFNASVILGQIAAISELSLIDRLLYRFVLIPGTRKALREQAEEFAWTDTRPDWGRGRIDPFNPVKVTLLGVDVGDTIGNSDMVPIWNLKARQGHDYHWDGLNADLREVFESSALGDGATPKTLPSRDLERLEEWLTELEPPAFPYAIDGELANTGAGLFAEHCASCHAPDGERTGQVLDWQEVKTDRHRIDMWTQEAADAYNSYGQSEGLDFEHFKAPDGYVNVPLDGVWIRAPYLHNGSVPTLLDLLQPPQSRPTLFYRGWDVFDPEPGGFVTSGTAAERYGFRYDTSEAGNSNQGHLWGTELEDEEKQALVEYMKTL